MRGILISACVVGVLVLLSPVSSQAALIAYDGFAGDPGPLNGTGGGTGWSGNWTAPATHSNVAGSMSYSDGTQSLPTSGNQARIDNSGSTSAAFRDLSAPFTLSEANPELWISFTAVAQNATGGHVGFSLFNNTSEQTLLGKRGGTAHPNWGISVSAGGGSSVTGTVQADAAAFLLYKFTWTSASTPATIELWVNPDLDSAPASATRDVSTTINPFTFNRVRLSTATNNGNLDELRHRHQL